MNLLQSTWLEIILFNLSFRSTPYTGIMVYADDFKCSIEDSSKFSTPTELDLISRKLSKKMSDLAVTKEEYILLKTMLLLNPGKRSDQDELLFVIIVCKLPNTEITRDSERFVTC